MNKNKILNIILVVLLFISLCLSVLNSVQFNNFKNDNDIAIATFEEFIDLQIELNGEIVNALKYGR